MTPTPTGRHCAACQQTVVDFTQQTDAEILAYLAGAAGPACGRFRAGQLARPLRPVAPAAPRWRTWLAALVAAGGALGAGRAAAQTTGGSYFSAGPTPAPAAQPAAPAAALPPASAPAAAPSAAEAAGAAAAEVRGVVTDAKTGERLPGATVLRKGTMHYVATDATGAFVLPLEEGAQTVQLVISSVGFVSQEKSVASHGSQPLLLAMAEDTHMLGEVVMAGAYETIRPWPWHPRRLFHWTKDQLSRPFRR